MNADLWMGKAREALKKVEEGKRFVLKDLFDGVEWMQLKKGEVQYLGRVFKSKVDNGEMPAVVDNARTSGSNRYIKKEK